MLFGVQAEEVVILRIKRSPRVIAGAAVIGLIAAGGAFAYWTADGGGTGTAATGSGAALSLIVSQTTPTDTLKPGGSIELDGLITNPNPDAISLNPTSTLDAAITSVTPLANKTCDATAYTIAKHNLWITGAVIPGTVPAPTLQAPNSVQWMAYTLSMADNGANQDGCKGATINIKYTVVL